MADENKLVPKESGPGAVEVVSMGAQRIPSFDLSPREPHLYDYLVILRKHQWLILSFLLAVVTIVSIATFRMEPVYTTTARIEIDRENTNILPFQGADSYDFMMDQDNYIETQSRILTSETLALQTIRNSGLIPHSEMQGGPSASEAITSGSLANHRRPPELGAFLGSLTVKRVPQSRLLDVSFESTDPQLAAQILNAHIQNFMEQQQLRGRGRIEAIQTRLGPQIPRDAGFDLGGFHARIQRRQDELSLLIRLEHPLVGDHTLHPLPRTREKIDALRERAR